MALQLTNESGYEKSTVPTFAANRETSPKLGVKTHDYYKAFYLFLVKLVILSMCTT